MPPLGWVLFTLRVPMARKEPCAISQKTTFFYSAETCDSRGGPRKVHKSSRGGGARPGCSQNCPALPRAPGGEPRALPPRPQKCAESLLGPTYFPGDAQGFSENSQKSQNRVFKILKTRFLGFLETGKPDSGISGKYSGVAGLRRGARCLLDFS